MRQREDVVVKHIWYWANIEGKSATEESVRNDSNNGGSGAELKSSEDHVLGSTSSRFADHGLGINSVIICLYTIIF